MTEEQCTRIFRKPVPKGVVKIKGISTDVGIVFQCIVNHSHGSVTSECGLLIVKPAVQNPTSPTIVTQPQNQTLFSGQQALTWRPRKS